MVRVSLEGLLPGLQSAGEWLARVKATPAVSFPPSPAAWGRGPGGGGQADTPAIVAHVLAGNTPLLAWPGLAASLLAGAASFVKMSRGETLWPRLFVESLAEVDAELAALIHLDVWPGNDPRTEELVQSADAVIAYGSDASLDALRAATPEATPFFGYGHALSIGLWLDDEKSEEVWNRSARGFARDILLYDQGGCLSPHTVFVEGDRGHTVIMIAHTLADALTAEVETLQVPPVTDPAVALAVRNARDIAHFSWPYIKADEGLRWSVIYTTGESTLPEPVGHGVVYVLPMRDVAANFGSRLGAARGHISSVGVAGVLREDVRAAILREGVSRICAPGEMQAPPLDWPNGGHDLLASLLRVKPR